MQPFLISLFFLIMGSVGIGAIAQIGKGRTGAGWAVITFLVGVAWWLLFETYVQSIGSVGISLNSSWQNLIRTEMSVSGFSYRASLIALLYFAGVPFALMAIVVWTLPERRPARSETLSEQTRPPQRATPSLSDREQPEDQQREAL